jgi:transmembrane sensor
MAESKADIERAEREAADWFMRLGAKVIPAGLVEDFYAWRREPLNHQAYGRIESLWRKSGRLASDPDIDLAVHAALERGAARRKAGLLAEISRKRGLGLAILALAAITTVYVLNRPDGYATRVGEQRVVRLGDGSRITLDTNSAVTVSLDEHRREIRLSRGQAFFDVAADPARPFVVATDRGQVRALGTRFEVELRGEDLQVTLVEGAVEVLRRSRGINDAAPLILSPGQRVTLATAGDETAQLRPVQVDVTIATSWTTGRLTFRETPLAEAVAEVNRYSREKIELRGDEVGARAVSGAFDAGDTQAFAGAVSELLDLRQSRAGGKIVLESATPRTGD